MSIYVRYFEQLELNGGNHQEAIEAMKKDKRPLVEFKSKSGAKPISSGVSIWGRPFKIKRSNGTIVAVYLIDSEGTSGVGDEVLNHEALGKVSAKDLRNLILTSLISSVSLYTYKGQIKAEEIRAIHEFSNILKFLSLYDIERSDFHETKSMGDEKVLQSLIFVHKDFSAYDVGIPDNVDDFDPSKFQAATTVKQFGFQPARNYNENKLNFLDILYPYVENVDFFAVPEPFEWTKDKDKLDDKLQIGCEFSQLYFLFIKCLKLVFFRAQQSTPICRIALRISSMVCA